MHINRPRIAVKITFPNRFEEMIPGQHNTWPAGERGQKLELLGAQRNFEAVDDKVPRIELNSRVAKGDHIDGRGLCRCRFGAASQHGANAGSKLQRIEWLGEIVIRAEVEPFDFVAIIVESGQYDDWHIGALADAPADSAAVEAGEHHVEDDGINLLVVRLDVMERGDAVPDHLDVVTFAAEIQANKVSNSRIVFHN